MRSQDFFHTPPSPRTKKMSQLNKPLESYAIRQESYADFSWRKWVILPRKHRTALENKKGFGHWAMAITNEQ